jgi:RNA polymerase sigma-70 factor (ECF subfamily)
MAAAVEDLGVIRSLQAGDRDSFACLVREYRPGLLAYARRRTSSASAAEDLVQETFLRAYKSISRLSDDSRLGPWLYRILGNVCIDDAHRRSRDAAKATRVSADPALARVGPSIEAELGLDSDTTDLHAALAELPDGYREALTLRFVDELSYGEVAQISGLSEDNARARVSRARHAMRVAMRGAAAVPMFVYVLFRRSDRTAHALDRVQAKSANSAMAKAAADGGAQANRFSTLAAPVINSANNLVSAAPASAPMFGRVAAGATLVVVTALGVASSNTDQPAATAPVPVQTTVAITTAQVAQRVEPPVVEAPVVDATAAPTVAVTPTTLDLTPYVAPTTAAPVAVLPPVGVYGGSLSATALNVAASGLRYDLSGPVTLVVNGVAISGSLSGRIGVDEAAAGDSQLRLSGEITVNTAGGESIELRLVGYGSGSTDPLSLVLSGAFRASANSAGLAPSGSFSGSVESAFLTLTLNA